MRRTKIGHALIPAAMLMAGAAIAKPAAKPKQAAIHDKEDAASKAKIDAALERFAERPNMDDRLRRRRAPELQAMPKLRLAKRPTKLTVVVEKIEDGLVIYHPVLPRLKTESEGAYNERMKRARKNARISEKYRPYIRRRFDQEVVLELRNDQDGVAHVTGVTEPRKR